jgi:hypothetical protein
MILQFALVIHLGRIWLVRRSGQNSTAFECRVLAANRNPVADPIPAETMFPLSELDRMLPRSDTALHTAAGSERGATQFPTIGLFERMRTNIKRNQKHEGSKIVVISRGTGSSNPPTSSAESGANHRAPEARRSAWDRVRRSTL